MPSCHDSSSSQGNIRQKTLLPTGPVFRWQSSVALRPEPGDKPWPGGWLPGDPPVVIDTGDAGDAADPHAASRVFDTARQVRFLDALATCGEVRAAAA